MLFEILFKIASALCESLLLATKDMLESVEKIVLKLHNLNTVRVQRGLFAILVLQLIKANWPKKDTNNSVNNGETTWIEIGFFSKKSL